MGLSSWLLERGTHDNFEVDLLFRRVEPSEGELECDLTTSATEGKTSYKIIYRKGKGMLKINAYIGYASSPRVAARFRLAYNVWLVMW